MVPLWSFQPFFIYLLQCQTRESDAKGIPKIVHSHNYQRTVDERVPLLNVRYEFVFPQIEVLRPIEDSGYSNIPEETEYNESNEENDDMFYVEEHPEVILDNHQDPVLVDEDYFDNEYEETSELQTSNEEVPSRRKRHARMKCGGTITDVVGVIETPNYPYNYENNMECTWVIETPENTTVNFFCEDFDLQGSMTCQNDYLEVSESGDVEFKDSTRYCEDDSPNVHSTLNRLALKFKSNNFYRYKGFKCQFQAIAPNGTALARAFQRIKSTNPQLPPLCNERAQAGNDWNGRCGVPNSPEVSTRLVGSEAVGANEYPWAVAMIYRCGDTRYGTRQYCLICGGTVVSPDWILTAAHCISSRNISDVGVLLGDQNLFKVDTTQIFSLISEVVIYPEFNVPTPLNHDIALVRLVKPVKFSRFIAPICLPKPSEVKRRLKRQTETTVTESVTTIDPEEEQPRNISSDWALVGKTVRVLGWGVIDDDGNIADRLRSVDIKIIENNECDHFFGIMTDTMMCTSGEGGKGPCGGDSGGPTMILQEDGSYVQVGILAFGALAGCEEGYPSGQVLLSWYLDWIEYVTKGEVFK
ncbi:ovochymase-1-like isoform X2 [Artemia franciscana]|uniref:ovochymase-1-like isoform X2 n=1 Tax=Artemia franciscana TaxID=6661 RepID=UPI0032D9E54F